MESKSITVELSMRQKPSGAVVEEFRVLDSSGEEAPEPRKLLQRLFTLRAFDPLAFEKMKPKEKATLVQQLLGLDLSKFDKEYAKLFDERTVLGREGKALAAQHEAAKRYDDAPAEEVKVSELLSELEGLHGRAKERESVEKLARELHQENQKLCKEADSLVDEIAVLTRRLEETKSKIVAVEKGEAKAAETLKSLPDPAEEISAVKAKIAKVDETNSKVRANAAFAKLEASLKQSRGEYQKLSDRLTEIKEERAEAVAKAKWPMPGMELTEDGLLMDGLPFEQASTSQRIMASVKVGMALNPKLRLLVCQHGSDLDNDTLDALEAAAKEHDFQLLIELVTRSKEDEERCAVIIADGEVVGAEAPDKEESSSTEEYSSEE